MRQRLRAKQIGPLRFRRQIPIGPYVVDFVCLRAKLVVEIDGSQHADRARDMERTAWLNARGYRVVRFWNNDVLSNIDGVLEWIVEALAEINLPPPAPSLVGEG